MMFICICRLGPLHDGHQYKVTAEKEGFVMTEVAGTVGSFKAFKLGQINVQVQTNNTHNFSRLIFNV